MSRVRGSRASTGSADGAVGGWLADEIGGGVDVALSTDGRAPALAGLPREAFEALLPANARVRRANPELRDLT